MNVEYLDLQDVIDLHSLTLERDGGLEGREPGKLEAKLALPMSGYGDFEKYPSIEEKAAVYLYELSSGHCFVDGNKRTAYLSTFVEGEEVIDFVPKVANNNIRPPFTETVFWILRHAYKKEE
ncbi:type II toxin-antitoxin system death-on-curing family toxin [Lentibacillus cibarius]|uniref:Fido domain-containing protein n=1 Tax=Lentibacillus cibarius TaxID=2583219 RepID=A0A5S3QM31_9BACI|nr:Fic family protein [Lentibacillus cibarius]TMN22940.1 hypothetical protein FFL34_13225 [Lentibacillus cibarius]